MVGARIVKCPFCLESGGVDILLTLDAHDFRDFLTRNLLVGKLIFEYFHFLLLDQTVLAEVFQGFELLFLGLSLADALLTFEHLDEFLQLVIVEQLVFVDTLEGMAQILGILCRRNLLGVGLYFHSVSEFSGAVHEVEFLLCVIELAFYLTETLKVLVVVCDIQNLSAFYAEPGDTVAQGQIIAAVGATGWTTGPHLHLSVFVDDESVDPLEALASAPE